MCLVDASTGITYQVKKFPGVGRCYMYNDLSTGLKWANAVSKCSAISGWSLPTQANYKSLVYQYCWSETGSASNCPALSAGWCNDVDCSSTVSWWSATPTSNSTYVYWLSVSSTGGSAYGEGLKNTAMPVRCIKDE